MTKKNLDADAVECLFISIMKRGYYNIMGVEYSVDVRVLRNILHKINELATPAPEPQRSIFDADGWCWDLNKIPRTKHLKMGVFVQSDPVLLFYKGDLFVETVNFTVDGAIAENQNFYKADCWRPLPTIPTGGNHE